MLAPPTHMFWGVVSSAVLTINAAILVKLGRQLPDDSKEAPKCGRPDFARIVTQLVSMLPQWVRREELMREGFEAPSWESVTAGRRPAVSVVEDCQIGLPLFGWQQAAMDAMKHSRC